MVWARKFLAARLPSTGTRRIPFRTARFSFGFYQRTANVQALADARRERQRAQWTAELKRAAIDCGADDVGVTHMLPEYVFEGHPTPPQRWMIVIALKQSYEAMTTAPSEESLVEVHPSVRARHTCR
jgi:hypothetical protein